MDPSAWLFAVLAALAPAAPAAPVDADPPHAHLKAHTDAVGIDTPHTRRILDRLDGQRSLAFARGDPRLLRGVYTRSSPLRQADAATIAEYSARGLQIDGAGLAVLSLELRSSHGGRLRARVVDQLAQVHVRVPHGQWRDLPADEPTERVITLRRTPHGWRIAAAHQMAG